MLLFLLLILVIVGAVGGYYLYQKKKHANTGSSGSTGSTGPHGCSNMGQTCGGNNDCCGSLQCVGNKCLNKANAAPILAFFLTTSTGCVGNDQNGSLWVDPSLKCEWTSGEVPAYFWVWNGDGNLIYRNPQTSTSGKITVIDQAIQPPSGPGYVELGGKNGGIVLIQSGAIYSSDYQYCISVDQTGHLIWTECLGYPFTFSMVEPTGCTLTGVCTNDAQCCPPYGSCLNGMCSNCFGDPQQYQNETCPGAGNYVTCAADTAMWTCNSRCDAPPPSCLISESPLCGEDDHGRFNWSCASKCTGDSSGLTCDAGEPLCTGSDGSGWAWTCPYNPCDHPDKFPTFAPGDAAPPAGPYSWDAANYRYVSSNPGDPFQVPYWNCNSSTWTFMAGCDTGYKEVCSQGQKAVCGNASNFAWQCVDDTSNPNLCGLSIKPDCDDAQCLDVTVCAGEGNNNGTDWRWICPSDQNTTTCDIIKANQWVFPPLNINNQSVTFQNADTPIYPTVDNDSCRAPFASYIPGIDIQNKIGNPAINISGGKANPYSSEVVPASPDGISPRLYTLFNTQDSRHPQWYCGSDNPCYPNGGFLFTGQTSYSPIAIPPDNVFSPPSHEELMAAGSCSCNPGFAGLTCEHSRADCSGDGVPQLCNTADPRCMVDFSCNCDPGFAGIQCQGNTGSCSLHGQVQSCSSGDFGCFSELYMCVCDAGWTGPNCQYSDATSCASKGTAKYDGTCTCTVPNVQGPNCQWDPADMCNGHATSVFISTDPSGNPVFDGCNCDSSTCGMNCECPMVDGGQWCGGSCDD